MTTDNLGSFANNPGNATPMWQAAKYYVHSSTAQAGLLVATGPGVLLRVCINTPASGSTLVMYDGTSAAGAVIANIATATAPFGFMDYGVSFVNGLFIVVAGGAPDLTLMYLQ